MEDMTDEEYKEFVIGRYGHIKGLAQTLLAIRKSGEKAPEIFEGIAGKTYTKEDIANYHLLKEDINLARRLLNKLHVRLIYAEKEKTYKDVPYQEIRDILEEVTVMLKDAQAMYVEPELERQRHDLMLDYIEY